MAGGGPGGGRPLAPPLEAGRRGSAIYRKPGFPACCPLIELCALAVRAGDVVSGAVVSGSAAAAGP